jgi:RNA polymerase sigma factor (sigma-70 family)
MDCSTRTDDELLAAAAGNAEAFAVFYRRHSQALFRYMLYRTRSGEHAAELTAEVFASAFEGVRRYRADGTPARAWLFGIANHKLADSARRRRVDDRARRRLGIERLHLEDRDLERAEELVDLERAGGQLEALVEDLPPAERDAVLARVVREQSYLELAEVLGVSQETARKRVSRGLARLAFWAKEENEDVPHVRRVVLAPTR